MDQYEDYVPTVLLSYRYSKEARKPLLHQLYVTTMGKTQWRKVPMESGVLPQEKKVVEVYGGSEDWDDRGMLRRGWEE